MCTFSHLSMAFILRCGLGGALALAMALRGLRSGSLSTTGAAAAAIVGTMHMACGIQYGLLLIAFYLSSSKATKLGQELKQKLEADFKQNGQRNAVQVLCNSLWGCLAAAAAAWCKAEGPGWNCWQAAAQAAFLGHYACCCGDTWASEIGILSSRPPRLITTGRTVPRGTNGGVTGLGFACSAAAGILMGAVFGAALPWEQQPFHTCSGTATGWLGHPLVAGAAGLYGAAGGGRWLQAVMIWTPLGILAAVLGSFLDSLLGATLQYSGRRASSNQVVNQPGKGVVHISGVDLLSNNAVNVWAAGLTASMCGIALLWSCC